METDGASGATSFVVDDLQYLVVTNIGNHNRYETVSRLYRVNDGGDLTVVCIMTGKTSIRFHLITITEVRYVSVLSFYI